MERTASYRTRWFQRYRCGGKKVFSRYPATAREKGSFDSARFRRAVSSLGSLSLVRLHLPISFVLSALFPSLIFLSNFVVGARRGRSADDGGWQIPRPPPPQSGRAPLQAIEAILPQVGWGWCCQQRNSGEIQLLRESWPGKRRGTARS